MEEGNSISSLVILTTMMPFYFASTYLSNPNGLIPRILSYIPFSAPLSLSLRMAFTTVPTWEIALIFAILLTSIVLVFWISGKAFKRGLLEFNKRLKLSDLFAKEVK
jgi:ABC-2 type transport system permease protein